MEPNKKLTGVHKSHKEVQIIAIGIILITLVGIYFFGKSLWQGERRDEASYQSLVGENEDETYPTITPQSLQKMISTPGEKFTLVDIRSRDAYNLSHIRNALSYPDTSLTSVTLPAGSRIIVIGSDTDEDLNNSVAKYLNDKGLNYAFLKGGHNSWVTENQAVVTTGDPSSFIDQSKVRFVSPEDVKKRFQNNEKIFVLDVQPAENYRIKHLKDAQNIPLAELETRIAEVPSGERIVVYGTNEAESFQAGVKLFDLNIFGVETISGDQVLNSGLFTEGQ